MTFLFCDPNRLGERMRSGVLEAHEDNRYPLIYNIYTVESKASVGVHNNQIFALYAPEEFFTNENQFAIGTANNQELYFYLTHLSNDSIRELVPFLCDYDISKLIENRRYNIISMYLQWETQKKQIPAAAMKEPFMTNLFLDAGWYLPFQILFQYYNSILYRYYYASIRKVLERDGFHRDDKQNKIYSNFLELAIERGDQVICELLDLHG